MTRYSVPLVPVPPGSPGASFILSLTNASVPSDPPAFCFPPCTFLDRAGGYSLPYSTLRLPLVSLIILSDQGRYQKRYDTILQIPVLAVYLGGC